MRTCAALLIALFALGSYPAYANWNPNGVPLTMYHLYNIENHILDDGSGGLLVWRYTQGGTSGPHLIADRLSALGNLFPNWDAGEIAKPRFGSWGVGDGLGGLYETWGAGTRQVYLRHVVQTGGSDPGWPAAGLGVSGASGSGWFPAAAEDGANGAFVGYSVSGSKYVVKRVLPDASFAPGWPAAGRTLDVFPIVSYSYYLTTRALPDGAGGAYFVWASDYLRIQRITASSAIAAGWPAPGGIEIGDQAISDLTDIRVLEFAPSGPDSFVVAWYEATASEKWIEILKLDRDGNVGAGWPARCGPPPGGALESPQVVPDGLGGFWAGWDETTSLHGSQVRPGGVVDHDRIDLLEPGTSHASGVVLATGPTGGLIVCWSEPDTYPYHGSVLHARWLIASGAADPSQPPAGRVVSSNHATAQSARGDGNGGAYVIWYEGGILSDHVYMNWLPYPQQSVDVPREIGAATFNLVVSPNPVREDWAVRFTLPTPALASLELLDIAGRTVRRSEVTGAGVHAESFDRVAELPAGVYFVRLSQGHDVRVARVARVR